MALHNLQMKMMLLDNGASSMVAAAILSSYATGVLVGRLLCGVALDRWPAHIVAAVSMGLPCIGLLLIAAPLDTTPVLAVGGSEAHTSELQSLMRIAYAVFCLQQ